MKEWSIRKTVIMLLFAGALMATYYLAFNPKSQSLGGPGSLRKTFEISFLWEEGLKSLRVVDVTTGTEESDASLRKTIVAEAGEAVSRLVRRLGLKRAKGKLYMTVQGYEEPYLVEFRDPVITEPDVELLLSAAADGDLARVERLLAAEMEVNARDVFGGRTAVMYAAAAGQSEMVKVLLSAGADPNLQDNTGGTALMIASFAGHIEVVKTLLTAGAKLDVRDDSGETALTLAQSRGHVEIVKLLRERQRRNY